jgi:hypothetical protein
MESFEEKNKKIHEEITRLNEEFGNDLFQEDTEPSVLLDFDDWFEIKARNQSEAFQLAEEHFLKKFGPESGNLYNFIRMNESKNDEWFYFLFKLSQVN